MLPYKLKWCFLLLFFLVCKGLKAQIAIPYEQLSCELEGVLAKDQGPRDTLNKLALKYGTDADTVRQYWNYIHTIDSINTLGVSGILDTYGWPDQRLISPEASKALWLVIQHADSLTREKYLPVLEQAAAEGKAPKNYFAYLYDRVQMFRGRFQLYGTQMGGDYEGNTVLWPVKKMLQLDARRKAMGLRPIQEALTGYRICWSDPVYDSLAGNIVFYGLVSNQQGQRLPRISIYEPSGKLAGTTNERGYFRVLANRAVLQKGLIFKGDGYPGFKYSFRNKNAEVYHDEVLLPGN